MVYLGVEIEGDINLGRHHARLEKPEVSSAGHYEKRRRVMLEMTSELLQWI